MVEEDFGEATIVYEGTDGTEERTVPNEHVAYFQDHWLVKTGETDDGRDTVRRIPAYRVYHVERTVETFEEEIATLADQVRSFTEDLRQRLPIGPDRGGDRPDRAGEEAVEIDVEAGSEASDSDAGEPAEQSDGSTESSSG